VSAPKTPEELRRERRNIMLQGIRAMFLDEVEGDHDPDFVFEKVLGEKDVTVTFSFVDRAGSRIEVKGNVRHEDAEGAPPEAIAEGLLDALVAAAYRNSFLNTACKMQYLGAPVARLDLVAEYQRGTLRKPRRGGNPKLN